MLRPKFGEQIRKTPKELGEEAGKKLAKKLTKLILGKGVSMTFQIGETVYKPIESDNCKGCYISDVYKGIIEDAAISRKGIAIYYVHWFKDGMSTKIKEWLPEEVFIKKKNFERNKMEGKKPDMSTDAWLDFFNRIEK